MMNVLALGLVLSSLAAAGVWSPHPEKPSPTPTAPDGLVKEGHRLIVVEYERTSPGVAATTDKSLHPPDHPEKPPSPSAIIHEAEERLKKAAEVLPNVGQGISMPTLEVDEGGGEAKGVSTGPVHHAKEKICDAYGVCKEKFTGLFGKSKDKAAHLKDRVEDAAADEAEATDAVEHAAGKAAEVRDRVEHAASDAVHKVSDVKDEVKENASAIAAHAADKASEARRNLTDILRRARNVARDAWSYALSTETAKGALAVAHLAGFATAYGACVWVTFASSHVLAGALPRQQFGVVQSRLYPVYFRAVAYSVGVAFLAHYYGAGRKGTGAERVQGYNLLGALGLVLANMLFLEPRATKVMFESMKMEKEEGRGRDMADVGSEHTAAATQDNTSSFGAARSGGEHEGAKGKMANLHRKLKALNSYSSFLNILTLMSLTWHLVHLAQRLQGSCN